MRKLSESKRQAQQKYEELLSYGRESYNSQIWPEARQAFEDASALEPTLAEPLIYLAKLELAEQDLESALSRLTKLEKRLEPNTTIYMGFVCGPTGLFFQPPNFILKLLFKLERNSLANLLVMKSSK